MWSARGRADQQFAEAAAAPPASSARPDDELLPFLNNFHDIFTTIGVVILFSGLGVGAGVVFDMSGYDGDAWPGVAVWATLLVLIGVAAWLLSALLVGKQRRILPGIVLSLVVTGAFGVVLAYLYSRLVVGSDGLAGAEAAFEKIFAMDSGEISRAAVNQAAAQLPAALRFWPVAAALCFALPIFLYYRAFRLPFAGGLAGVAAAGIVFAAAFSLEPYLVAVWNPTATLAFGLVLFLAGIVFDARDPGRETRLSGTGFWLHFFAAPVLISAVVNIASVGWRFTEESFTQPGAFGPLAAMASGDEAAAVRSAVATLLVIAAMALVSLLINRRALIVSALITAGIAIAVLVSQLGLDAPGVVAVTLLALGGVVVLLGAAWNPARRVLTAPFPRSGPLSRIIPPVTPAE